MGGDLSVNFPFEQPNHRQSPQKSTKARRGALRLWCRLLLCLLQEEIQGLSVAEET